MTSAQREREEETKRIVIIIECCISEAFGRFDRLNNSIQFTLGLETEKMKRTEKLIQADGRALVRSQFKSN